MGWNDLNRKCPSLRLSSRITHNSFHVARRGLEISSLTKRATLSPSLGTRKNLVVCSNWSGPKGALPSTDEWKKKNTAKFHLMQFISTLGTILPSYSPCPIMWHTLIYKVSRSTLFCLRQLSSRITACFLSLIKSLHTPAAWQQRQLSALQKKPYQEKNNIRKIF